MSDADIINTIANLTLFAVAGFALYLVVKYDHDDWDGWGW